jgi:hypothetical protein
MQIIFETSSWRKHIIHKNTYVHQHISRAEPEFVELTEGDKEQVQYWIYVYHALQYLKVIKNDIWEILQL